MESPKSIEEAKVDELVAELRKRTPCLVLGLVQETNHDSTIKIVVHGHTAAKVGVAEMVKLTLTREALQKICEAG